MNVLYPLLEIFFDANIFERLFVDCFENYHVPQLAIPFN